MNFPSRLKFSQEFLNYLVCPHVPLLLVIIFNIFTRNLSFNQNVFLGKFFNIFLLRFSVLPVELFHQHFCCATQSFFFCFFFVPYLAQNSRYFLSLLPGCYPTLGCVAVQQGAGLVEGIRRGTGANAAATAAAMAASL